MSITLSLVERGQARKRLTRASLALIEAEALIGQAKFDEAALRLDDASALAAEAERAVISLISRYLDPAQVRSWKQAADETIADSKKRGVTALIVSKLERRLAVYKNGKLYRTYDVGLGFNGLADKRIRRRQRHSRGPLSRSSGRSPPASTTRPCSSITRTKRTGAGSPGRRPGGPSRYVGIGGDVEIHGGGQDSLTRGCVSIDNDKMDELFDLVAVGTPVTIVGTMELENYVIKSDPGQLTCDQTPPHRRRGPGLPGVPGRSRGLLLHRLETGLAVAGAEPGSRPSPTKTLPKVERNVQQLAEEDRRALRRRASTSSSTRGRTGFTSRKAPRSSARPSFPAAAATSSRSPAAKRKWVFDTPRGEFAVKSKITNPYWVKPDWAFIEEGEPIPKNQEDRIEAGSLGDYALGFGDGYFIHGTLYTRLLGRNVTHGCVRVGDEDLKDIFKTVPMGAKIYIY